MGWRGGKSGSETDAFIYFLYLHLRDCPGEATPCTSSLFLLKGSGQSCSMHDFRRSGYWLLQVTNPLLKCSHLLAPHLALSSHCSSFLPRLLDRLFACSVLLRRKQPPVSAIDICSRCRLKRLVGWVGEFSITICLTPTAYNVSF